MDETLGAGGEKQLAKLECLITDSIEKLTRSSAEEITFSVTVVNPEDVPQKSLKDHFKITEQNVNCPDRTDLMAKAEHLHSLVNNAACGSSPFKAQVETEHPQQYWSRSTFGNNESGIKLAKPGQIQRRESLRYNQATVKGYLSTQEDRPSDEATSSNNSAQRPCKVNEAGNTTGEANSSAEY